MKQRLKEILAKLSHIPVDDEELKRFYIFYKEDIRYLLEHWEEEDGILTRHNIELP